MCDVKLVDISGKKKKEYLKAKIDELEANSKIENTRDLCRGINDFK
jgi:BMFP domain-containing protein YqiC